MHTPHIHTYIPVAMYIHAYYTQACIHMGYIHNMHTHMYTHVHTHAHAHTVYTHACTPVWYAEPTYLTLLVYELKYIYRSA